MAVCAKNQPQANELNLAKFEMAYEEVGDVVDEKIDWMIAVAVAGGNAKQIPKPVRKAAPARPAGDDDSDDGEDDDDDNLDYDPGMKPMGQHNTHVQSNRAQVWQRHASAGAGADARETIAGASGLMPP